MGNLSRLILLILVLAVCSSIRAQVPDSSKSDVNSIDSPREALEVALAFSGFEEIEPLLEAEDYSGVTRGVFQDSTIRFLAEQLWNKTMWRIVIQDVNITLPRSKVPREEQHNPRTVHIVLDSASGSFITAHYDHEGVDSDAPVQEHCDRLSGEAGLGLCFEAPPVQLDSALGNAVGSDVTGSKSVTAFLVWQLFDGEQTRIWYVTGRGFARGLRPWIHSALTKVHGEDGRPLSVEAPG